MAADNPLRDRFDFGSSFLLSVDVELHRVTLVCDLKIESNNPEREYQVYRLVLSEPHALDIEMKFPNLVPPESEDDLGSIDVMNIEGPMDAASVRVEFSYGTVSVASCRLEIVPLAEREVA